MDEEEPSAESPAKDSDESAEDDKSGSGGAIEFFGTDIESEEVLNCLTYDEASRCLRMLGKNDSGLRYSYLMMNASERNLTDISAIGTFRNVLFVDVSGNRLTRSSLKVLFSMTYLLMIRADRNKIESSEMDPMLYLQVLSLNRNEITDTSGISHRPLECLELNYNKITSVSLNPYVLDNIKTLELRGNLLKTTNGIFFPSLVSLYIGDNAIERIEGLETLVNLKTLHARDNRISILDGLNIPECVKLRYINLRSNKISKFSEIVKLRNLPGLETLVISENPLFEISEDDNGYPRYRIKLISAIPNLKRINKDPVLEDEIEQARELRENAPEDGRTSSTDSDREENGK